MKKISAAFLVTFIILAAFAALMSDSTVARYSSVSVNFNNTFTAANYAGPSLQEQINLMMNDILQKGILEKANQNFNHKKSWAIKISDYLIGNSGGSNIYGFQNPVSSLSTVLMTNSLDIPEGSWNPAVFIASGSEFDHNAISSHPNFSRLFGTMMIVKQQGQKSPVTYYAIEADGTLGGLNSFPLPKSAED